MYVFGSEQHKWTVSLRFRVTRELCSWVCCCDIALPASFMQMKSDLQRKVCVLMVGSARFGPTANDVKMLKTNATAKIV